MATNLGVPEGVQEVINESQSQILARLKLTGVSNEDAAKQLGVSNYRVRKLEESEEFKTHLRAASEGMITAAAHTWKGLMQDLIPLAYQALRRALAKGDLRGVEIIVKTLGIEKQAQAPSQGVLQVILPDYKQEKVIDVEVKD